MSIPLQKNPKNTKTLRQELRASATPAEKLLWQYIKEKQIDNYADFLMICIETSDDWFNIAINYNTLAINKMIDAVWQKKKSGASIISEGEIGEVLSEDEKPKLSGEDN